MVEKPMREEKLSKPVEQETSLTIDGYRVPGVSRPLNEAEYRIWLSTEYRIWQNT
jgi:hypothetical protein